MHLKCHAFYHRSRKLQRTGSGTIRGFMDRPFSGLDQQRSREAQAFMAVMAAGSYKAQQHGVFPIHMHLIPMLGCSVVPGFLVQSAERLLTIVP